MDKTYTFLKPSRQVWDSLVFFEKVAYYGTQLTREYAPFVDKLEAKQQAKRLCPFIHIPKVIKIFQKEDQVTPADLIPNCYFKASHGCGWNLWITPKTKTRLVNKKKKEWHQIFSTREKQYTFLTPMFFLEEKIDSWYPHPMGNMVDIKVMCIYGIPVFLLIELYEQSMYLDPTWSMVFQAHHPHTHKKMRNVAVPRRPHHWETIIEYAKMLSKPFECVRIDCYVDKNQMIYFSEFTFTHAGGRQRLDNHLETYFGTLWTYERPRQE